MIGSNWQYIGEGGRSAVFAFVGPDTDTELRGHVLRVAKDSGLGESGVVSSVALARSLAERWLGSSVVPVMDIVPVAPSFVMALCAAAQSQRPAHRLQRGLDSSVPVAILMPNLLVLPALPLAVRPRRVVTVEIKPKCGFLSVIMPSGATVPMCQFSLHERLLHRSSRYCPLDLFSDKVDRMLCALEALVAQPHNKLRVFVNGDAVLTQEILTARAPATPARILAEAGVNSIRSLCLTLIRELQASAVLSRLLAVQSIAQPHLWAVYYHNTASSMCAALENSPPIRQWPNHCDCQMLAAALPTILPPPTNLTPSPPLTTEQLEQFLTAKAAMDCSIMTTLAVNDDDGDDQSMPELVHASVKIIDLDVKSGAKLLTYQQQNQAFVGAYLQRST